MTNSCIIHFEKNWGGSVYIVTENGGKPIGFFVYSINVSDNSGFLKFVIMDNELRGKGYGTKMLELFLKYAFDITGVSSVQLNVFDNNKNAKKCYLNVGFIEDNNIQNAFTYNEECWDRCHMIISS